MNTTFTRRRLLERGARLAGALAAVPVVSGASSRPNIILCMGDDHGWNETGYNGHPYLRTPVLDEMAARGVRFNNFFAATPYCSPTRGSVLTGRHPNRYGTLAPNWSIRPEEITLAHVLKPAGYACGHFGKWHLGPVKAGSPTNPGAMGFDEWLSHDNFFEMNPLLVRNGGAPQVYEGESSEVVVRETIQFIEKVKKRPFFTVVWFGSPHGPYSGLDADLALYRDAPENLRARFAEITAMDRAIGRLREYLRRERLAGNTILWYCGDNGTPSDARLNMLYRGNKGSVYDGGLRVPGIIEWPDAIPRPRVIGTNAVTSDMLPTLARVARVPLPARPLDGIDLNSALQGRMRQRPSPICFWFYDYKREGKESPGPYLPLEAQTGTTPTARETKIEFVNRRHPQARTSDFGGEAAILGNRYKLVAPKEGILELYDVSADPGESKDLGQAHPAIAREMESHLRRWQRSVEVSLTGADYNS